MASNNVFYEEVSEEELDIEKENISNYLKTQVWKLKKKNQKKKPQN